MGRYSPTVDQISGLEALAGIGEGVADSLELRRARQQEAEERAQAAEDRDLDRTLSGLHLNEARARLHATGYRDTAPTVRDEPDTPNVFAGAELDRPGGQRQVPEIFEDERPSFLPTRREPMARGDGGNEPEPPIASALTGLQRPRQPKIVVLPGAYRRNRGFTERAVTDLDLMNEQAEAALQPDTRIGLQRPDRPASMAGGRRAYLEDPTRETVDPDYDPLPGGGFMKRSGTPAAQEAEALARLAAAEGATEDELEALRGSPKLADRIFARIDERKAKGGEDAERQTLLNAIMPYLDDEDRALAPRATLQQLRVVQAKLLEQEGPETPANAQLVETADGFAFFDPRTRKLTPIAGAPKPKAPAGATRSVRPPTEGQRKAQALAAVGREAYTTLEGVLAAGEGVPGFWGTQMARVGLGAGNVLAPDEIRQMRQSANALSDAWLRYTSGASVPEQEVERFASSFIPVAGDDDQTLQQKSELRRVMIEALERAAGSETSVELPDDIDAATQEALRLMGGGG